MTFPWLSGGSFFQPVTRAKPGWRPWVPVWLGVGALLLIFWQYFSGGRPLEFDRSLLPDTVRVTLVTDRTHSGKWLGLEKYIDPYMYELYANEVSAHAVYLRYDGTLGELGFELAKSPLAREYLNCGWRGDALTFVSPDGRTVLELSDGISALPWERTSFVIHSQRMREPDHDLLRRAR
jgi:hypothetical protein